ncbi:CDP-glucose 4,6-dehydratase [Cohnella faecalis]|uniref:CDP-glucose 4,6-dehydratase n=2 Tax=Cohnella faecalis TaxID=2315694 RepID=A0A398CKD9_9BACL|nr:CDP-glucose 4,6-dehydratase [Cohnella faecalis]
MSVNPSFWRGKKVFMTGHTGFKGAWLAVWLRRMGADVTGYALRPPAASNLFELCNLDELVPTVFGDVRDSQSLEKAVGQADPDVVFHLAARPLVRASYDKPRETFEVNVVGTVNMLEALRLAAGTRAVSRPRAFVNVTTDKVYDNRDWAWGYRENDALGGYDPYSGSKACSELVTASYRSSFWNPSSYSEHLTSLATARAGNVIGGGDWAADRLVPDAVRALQSGKAMKVRYPMAIRPWQHVLEPLSGYLMLAERLVEDGPRFGESWNFGPDSSDVRTVKEVLGLMGDCIGSHSFYELEPSNANPHEAGLLKLDCSKANRQLRWTSKWSLDTTVRKVLDWYDAYERQEVMLAFCERQIDEYLNGWRDPVCGS